MRSMLHYICIIWLLPCSPKAIRPSHPPFLAYIHYTATHHWYDWRQAVRPQLLPAQHLHLALA